MKEKVDIKADECETVINYSRYHIGDWAELYTTDKGVMKRVEKFCEKHPDYGKLICEDKYSMTFSLHPKCASLYPRAPRKMAMTDEARKLLADRMNKNFNRI